MLSNTNGIYTTLKPPHSVRTETKTSNDTRDEPCTQSLALWKRRTSSPACFRSSPRMFFLLIRHNASCSEQLFLKSARARQLSCRLCALGISRVDGIGRKGGEGFDASMEGQRHRRSGINWRNPGSHLQLHISQRPLSNTALGSLGHNFRPLRKRTGTSPRIVFISSTCPAAFQLEIRSPSHRR